MPDEGPRPRRMRLLYAPFVSERALRIEAGRFCWWRKGSRKEDRDVKEEKACAVEVAVVIVVAYWIDSK